MDARRLLQGLYYVDRQEPLDRVILQADTAIGKQVANHALAALVHEEGVAADASIFDRGVAWQDFGIDIAQDHIGGRTVIPRHQLAPQLGFIFEQGTEVLGTEMP